MGCEVDVLIPSTPPSDDSKRSRKNVVPGSRGRKTRAEPNPMTLEMTLPLTSGSDGAKTLGILEKTDWLGVRDNFRNWLVTAA